KPRLEVEYNQLGYLFDCKDWEEKNHDSETKTYMLMENEDLEITSLRYEYY
ncbi:10265_t:CDS:2, partial [Funneliformis caledonium]